MVNPAALTAKIEGGSTQVSIHPSNIIQPQTKQMVDRSMNQPVQVLVK